VETVDLAEILLRVTTVVLALRWVVADRLGS
jgi:hypothetical protein